MEFHPSLSHENEIIVRQNKQTQTPQGKFYFIIRLLKDNRPKAVTTNKSQLTPTQGNIAYKGSNPFTPPKGATKGG